MGFVHPVHEGLLKTLGVDLDPRGNVRANTSDYQTSQPNVFSAGDMRRGQSLVVWAIREGRNNPNHYITTPEILSLRWQRKPPEQFFHTPFTFSQVWVLERRHRGFSHRPESHYFGLGLGPRIVLGKPGSHFSVYVDGRFAVGAIDSSGPPYGQGQDLTFSALVGTGVNYEVNRRTKVSLGFLYEHFSNGGLSEPEVTKLAARASMGTKVESALQGLKGVSSVAYTSGDPVALAKALSTWMQENAEFTFKLGIVDGQVITVEEVKRLATMPSKEEIFSKLLYLINAPAQRLVTVMNAAGRDLAVVINQGVEKGKFAGAAEPAKAETAPPAPEAAAETPAPEAPATPEAAAAPAAEAVAETVSPAAEAAGTQEDSQTAAAATEAPVEG